MQAPADVHRLTESLLAAIDDPIVVLLLPDGTFGSWHPAVERTFGYAEHEFVGQHARLLLPPGDRDWAQRELDLAAHAGSALDTRWLATKSGYTRLVETKTIALRDGAGTLSGFGKLMRDVTESRNSEDSIAALARALEQSIVIVRQWNGTIDHWTAGCERLYGWSAVEAVGKRVQDLLKTAYPAPIDVIQEDLCRSGTWKGELKHIRRDGTHVFVSTFWVLLNESPEEPRTVIETHTDVTSRIQIQNELETANERLQSMALELERSNRELEEFARIASHDLSAPITSTRWLADLLLVRHGEKLDDSGRKIVKQISQGLERMSDLVAAVLAHARVGTTAIGSAEPVPATDALSIARENLRHHIETAGAQLECGPLPSVNIDKQALAQLFQNLLSNAIKYRRPEVAPHILITAEWKKPHWEFAVADNGIGIEPAWYERIFQPMQRYHGMDIAGSGIGLATCKKIVTRVGGQIWVESRLGEGSIFRFTLPGTAAV